jgi:hypothetical protein
MSAINKKDSLLGFEANSIAGKIAPRIFPR